MSPLCMTRYSDYLETLRIDDSQDITVFVNTYEREYT